MPPTPGSAPQTLDVRREVKQCPTCEQRFSRDAVFCPFDGVRLDAARVDPLSDPLIRARIDGRYDVLRLVGEGGMGRVYEVRHAALDRSFAMKVLRPELAREHGLAERFICEATATASVKHPNVVEITDFGQFPDGTPYFVMEFLVGNTLGEVLKVSGPLPPGTAALIARKVAGALGAAHAAGVVHRDLKPDNVFLVGASRDVVAPDNPERGRSFALLGRGSDVRVVDFGAAKVGGSSRLTRAGVVFGTPHYMSPEQASGQPVDHRADVYAVGVIMYEMIAGRVPFEADTYMGVLTQHMFVQPVPPSQLSASVAELGAFEAITLRCLAKKPADRFPSMEALIQAIDDVVRFPGVDDPGATSRSPSSHPPSGVGRAVGRGRAPTPSELELPSLAEMRVGLERSRSRPRTPPRVPWSPLAVMVGTLLAAPFAVMWLLSPAPPPAVDVRARVAPVLTAPARDPLPVGLVAAPPPTVVGSTEQVAPSVGEGSSAGPSHSLQPNRRRGVPSAGWPAPLDDVGDPFAGKP